MGLFKFAQKVVLKATTATANVITAGLEKVTGKKYGRTSVKDAEKMKSAQILSGVIVGAAAGLGAVAAGGAVTAAGGVRAAATTAAKTIGKKIIEKPVKSIATATAVYVGGKIISSSEKVQDKLIEAPSSISSFSENVGEFIDNPSAQTLTDIYKDSPVLSTALTAAAGLAVGKAASSIYAGYQTASLNETLQNTAQNGLPSDKTTSGGITQPELYPSATPTGTISTKTGRRRRKSKKATETPRISIKIDNRDNWDDRDTYNRKVYKRGRVK